MPKLATDAASVKEFARRLQYLLLKKITTIPLLFSKSDNEKPLSVFTLYPEKPSIDCEYAVRGEIAMSM